MGVNKRLVTCFILWISSHTASGAYNFTDEMASKCKPYYCHSGYSYPNMFEILGGTSQPDLKLEMHIAIKGVSDGHILLSPVANPGSAEPVYEFVVGAGANTFTELRRMKQKFGKMNQMTKNILSPEKYTAFWIKITKDGAVSIGREGSDLALVSYRDPMPLDVKYFSFAGWTGVDLRVLYDCPSPTDGTPEDSAFVDPVKTAVQRLKADLMKDYDRYSIPKLTNRDLIVLNLIYRAGRVSFDVAKSVLDAKGALAMTWIDQKLRWNPEDFDDLNSIQFGHDEVWIPELMIYDSASIHLLAMDKKSPIVALSDGRVVASYRVTTKTRCSPGPNMIHWPKDDHNCVIRLGLWSQYAMIELKLISDIEFKDLPDPITHPVKSQEWHMTKINLTSGWTSYSPYTQLVEEEEEEQKTNNHINITISFKRLSHEYTLLLYTPFASAVIIFLITFWVPSSSVTRMSILMLDLIFVFGCFTEVLEKLPVTMPHVPHILQFYVWAMICIWLSIALNVLILNLESKPTRVMNHFLKKILISGTVTKVLVLPEIKTKDTYNSLQEDNTAAAAMPSDDNQAIYWEMLVTAINRAMFIIFIILYAIIFSIHY